jgi:rhodanese-related sulfurtransferase
MIGLVLLGGVLFLWGRNLQAPTHVSEKAYDLLLSTLLSHNVPEISVDRLTSEPYQILDARTAREFEVSHIPGATRVGYEDFSLDRLAGIDTQAPVAIYCSVGHRSERIAEELHRRGYTNVVNVYGGIFDWVNRGNTAVTNDGAETKAIHAYSKLWGIWLNRGERVYE